MKLYCHTHLLSGHSKVHSIFSPAQFFCSLSYFKPSLHSQVGDPMKSYCQTHLPSGHVNVQAASSSNGGSKIKVKQLNQFHNFEYLVQDLVLEEVHLEHTLLNFRQMMHLNHIRNILLELVA